MDEQYWDSLLAGLNLAELRQLLYMVNERLAQHRFAIPTEGQVSLDPESATLCSNGSTLYPSGQSTPVRNSISSGRTSSLRSSHGDAFNRSLPSSTASPIWPMYTTSNQVKQFQSSLRHETPQETISDSGPIEPAAKQFFCTFCAEEEGLHKVIKTKQDWKRHEEGHHSGPGLQWICRVKGCSDTFSRGVHFTKHLAKGHGDKKHPRDCKNVCQLKRVYACGFENCRELNKVWKEHCNHVATHMIKGETAWTYDRTIRNLLKHKDISAQWKQIYGTLCPQLSIMPSDLTWDIRETKHMRDQLEFGDFSGPLEQFLLNLFLLGVPLAKRQSFMIQQPTDAASSSFCSAPPTIPPVLLSSIGFFDDNHPFEDIGTFPVSTGSTATVSATSFPNHRHSVFMADAPSLAEMEQFNATSSVPFGEVPSMADEAIENLMTEITPSYDPHLHGGQDRTVALGNGKAHSPRALVAKSKVWLASKKLHHTQSHVVEHPDVPANTRIPASLPRKKLSGVSYRERSSQV